MNITQGIDLSQLKTILSKIKSTQTKWNKNNKKQILNKLWIVKNKLMDLEGNYNKNCKQL